MLAISSFPSSIFCILISCAGATSTTCGDARRGGGGCGPGRRGAAL